MAERAFRWLVGLGERGRGEPDVLTRPQTGTVDARGRIYITDVGRPAVFVFDESEGKLFIWDQADGNIPFESPIGIAVRDTVNEILVADSVLARIVRLDFEGQPIGSFGQGILQRPTGLAWDPQSASLFVADTQTHSIKVFDAKGTFVREIGRQGSAPGEFNAPTHLAFKGGRLYVSDTLNARIQVLTAAGKPLKTVGRRELYLGNLTRPKGVTVDTEGRVYVVESYYDHLLIFDDKRQFLLPIGGTGSAIGKFYLPAGAWSDQRDRIFVADMFNGRVIIFEYLGT